MLIEIEPYSLSLPTGLESGQQLTGLLDDCNRVLRTLAPNAVLILEPETNNQLTYAQSRGRVTGETLFTLAAAKAELPCAYISRKTLRAKLDLPAKGKLADLVGRLVEQPMSPYWKGKRDLAALAALAGQEAIDVIG